MITVISTGSSFAGGGPSGIPVPGNESPKEALLQDVQQDLVKPNAQYQFVALKHSRFSLCHLLLRYTVTVFLSLSSYDFKCLQFVFGISLF